MKFAALIIGAWAIHIHNAIDTVAENKGIWGDAMLSVDAKDYNEEKGLEAYKGVEAPKIDYEAIARKKIEKEMKEK